MKLAPGVKGDPAIHRFCREAQVYVATLRDGPAGVVDYGLAEVVAVDEWLAGDGEIAAVERTQLEVGGRLRVAFEFLAQRRDQADGFLGAAPTHHLDLHRLAQLAGAFRARPGAKPAGLIGNVAQCRQTEQCRINPAVHGDENGASRAGRTLAFRREERRGIVGRRRRTASREREAGRHRVPLRMPPFKHLAADQPAEHASNQHVGGEVLLRRDARNAGRCGQ